MAKRQTASKAPTSPLDRLVGLGARREANGDIVIPAEVRQQLASERARRLTMTSVPTTPRHMMRAGGGIGVARGHGIQVALSLASLRHIRERSSLIQAIHSARNRQVRRMAKKYDGQLGHIGWRVVHRDHYEPGKEQPESIQPFIKRFERVMEQPSPIYCKTTSHLLSGLEEDLLTINRPVVEVLHSAFDSNRIVGFKPVDGALIWPTLEYLERWKRDTQGWNRGRVLSSLSVEDELEIASEALDHDLHGAEWCLVREGILEAVYPHGRLLVEPVHNRTDVQFAGYPPSCVDEALQCITASVNAFDYNANLFTKGMLAEFILGISGDVHPADIMAFVDQFREASQGVRRAHQPPIIPLPSDGVIEKIDLKPNNKEMMFEVWQSLLIALCTAVYRMDPTTINAKPWDGGSGPSLSEAGRGEEISLAQEEGLQTDLQHLTECIFTPLARRCHPDLMVVWEFGEENATTLAELNSKRCETSMTRNEARLSEGDPPMGFWISHEELKKLGPDDEDYQKFHANPWNMPKDQAFISAMQMVQQAEQMKQMQEQGGPPDGYGGEEDPNQPDDGFGVPQPPQPFGGPPQGPPGPPGAPPGLPGGPPQPGAPMTKARTITVFVESPNG